MIIPITVAWFAGSAWYMGRGMHRVGITPASSVTAPSARIHLGPDETPLLPQEPIAEEPVSAVTIVEDAPMPARLLTVRFAKNTQDLELSPEELKWCEAAGGRLAADPGASVVVSGHTDADGDATLNEALSLQRANIVRDLLIAHGLPAERITARGMGSSEPVSDNTTSKGKALNRRVEILLIEGH